MKEVRFIGWRRCFGRFRIGIHHNGENRFADVLTLYLGFGFVKIFIYKEKGVYDVEDWTKRFKKIHNWKNENIPEFQRCDKCANHIDILTLEEVEYADGLFYKVVKCIHAGEKAGVPILTDKNGHCDMFKHEKAVKPIKIAIDFDGTCVTHDYPKVGKDIGAVPVLKRLAADGHRLILNTMRCGKELQDAADWFKANDIPLYGVNEDPGQKDWTQSPKVFANLYIDDAALGCPLTFDPSKSERAFVDWNEVDKSLRILNFPIAPDPVLKE
jgi:hypothetical protein